MYGVRSAMSTREARSRCPHAAFLSGRFHAYRDDQPSGDGGCCASVSPLVEPLSLDEAFVDLGRAPTCPTCRRRRPSTAFAEDLRARVTEVTGGLTASVGIGTSKFIAKVASDLDKPDGLVVVAPGTERDLLRPMNVTVIPGVGPATAERLRRVGVHTVAELERVSEDELVRLLGKAQRRTGSTALARADDDRPVVAEREAKSVSVEGTYDTDLTDRRLMEGLLTRQAGDVAERLRKQRAVGTHGHDQGAAARLHHAEPLDHARLPHRHRGRRSPGWRARCSPTWTPPAASGCSASASPGWPTGSRRTCSARRRRRGRTRSRSPRSTVPHHSRRTWAPGHGRRARRDGPGLGVGLGPRAW